MKLGKDFFFWVRIIIAILRAIIKATKGNPNGDQIPGEVVVEAVLDVIIDSNEDDKLTSVKELLGRIDPSTSPRDEDNLDRTDGDLMTEAVKRNSENVRPPKNRSA